MKKLLSILIIIAVLLGLAVFPVSAAGNPFTDVPDGVYYHDAVLWAAEKGVTNGTSATTFSPGDTCTRGQVVTFLWRSQGCPEPKSAKNAFLDVKPKDYYYKPVLWAVEKGITNGTSAAKFSPTDTCTKEQIITFIWRAQGQPAGGVSGIAAVYRGKYFETAVAWADRSGLLAGVGTGFKAGVNCPRSDVVTYLYRFAASQYERLTPTSKTAFKPSAVPEYSGSYFIHINGNQPYFSENNLKAESYEMYGELDSLGRCTVCVACVGKDIMPTEERGSIGSVKPTGWQTVKYDCVEGKYLYNRSHLIGYQLTAENANKKNLITGTRYFNMNMLEYENLIAQYVEDYNAHVLYRVTPVFEGDDLVAKGVLLEGKSVEDGGKKVCFCVFMYNVQPGIEIDYANGNSREAEAVIIPTNYVLNTNSKKFHFHACRYADKIADEYREDFTGAREELIARGYTPCGVCDP